MSIYVYGSTVPKAYHMALEKLNMFGEVVDCRDYNTRCIESSIVIDVENPVADDAISRIAFCEPGALDSYLDEMLVGSLDWAIAEGKEPYTYHDRMVNYNGVNQINFVVDELKRNPNSRRAVIMVRHIDDASMSNPACLQHIQFTLGDGRLNCIAMFRSNDACKATFMNMTAIIELQRYIAHRLGVEIGTYTHIANSFHAYECDWELLSSMCKRIESGKNLTFSWKKYMKADRDYSREDKIFKQNGEHIEND